MIFRIGMNNFINAIGLKGESYNVKDLRNNIFYKVSEEDKTKMLDELNKSVGGE